MNAEYRIIQLERELIETRNAAVEMVVGMAKGIASSSEGREELAASFDAVASESNQVTRRLATLVAMALRSGS